MSTMPKAEACEFMIVRYAPDPVKGEFVNIGVVLLGSGPSAFTGVRFTRDWRRVRCLDPDADLETLARYEADLRAQLAGADRERMLQAMQESFSGALRVTPATGCLTAEPEAELQRLADMYCETVRHEAKREAGGRLAIHGAMRDAFEQAGVWRLMRKRIEVAKYTRQGDPLKIDCGYQPNGTLKMFHAVALANDVDAAKVLAFSFPRIAEGMAKREGVKAELTVITEDDAEHGDAEVGFALETLTLGRIRVAPVRELAGIAEQARVELRA